MSKQTNNLKLTQMDFEDTIRSTLTAYNENFEIIDDAITNIDCNIPKFVGTQEKPIDFSDLFEGIENTRTRSGYCILEGYCKSYDYNKNDLGVRLISDIFPSSMSTLLHYNKNLLVMYHYDNYSGEGGEIVFNTIIEGNIFTLYGTEGLGFLDEFDSGKILTITNRTKYTPYNDYSPAHKKYVDDAITNLQNTITQLESRIAELEGGAS